jgi:hypothetical protein
MANLSVHNVKSAGTVWILSEPCLVCFCGSVLVDIGEGRFGDVSVATSHAIVGRFVSFAEVCSRLGKADLRFARGS